MNGDGTDGERRHVLRSARAQGQHRQGGRFARAPSLEGTGLVKVCDGCNRIRTRQRAEGPHGPIPGEFTPWSACDCEGP